MVRNRRSRRWGGIGVGSLCLFGTFYAFGRLELSHNPWSRCGCVACRDCEIDCTSQKHLQLILWCAISLRYDFFFCHCRTFNPFHTVDTVPRALDKWEFDGLIFDNTLNNWLESSRDF